MHKGYTLNYFIDFFSSIPSWRWTTDRLQEGSTVQKCALGHCVTDQRVPDQAVRSSMVARNARVRALESFLNNKTASINDAREGYAVLGKTPRARILRALRNRKRTGNILGEN